MRIFCLQLYLRDVLVHDCKLGHPSSDGLGVCLQKAKATQRAACSTDSRASKLLAAKINISAWQVGGFFLRHPPHLGEELVLRNAVWARVGVIYQLVELTLRNTLQDSLCLQQQQPSRPPSRVQVPSEKVGTHVHACKVSSLLVQPIHSAVHSAVHTLRRLGLSETWIKVKTSSVSKV